MEHCPECTEKVEQVGEEDAYYCPTCKALWIDVDDEMDEQTGTTPGAGERYH